MNNDIKQIKSGIKQATDKFKRAIVIKDILALGDSLYTLYDDLYIHYDKVPQGGLLQLEMSDDIYKNLMPKLYKYAKQFDNDNLFDLWMRFFALTARCDFKRYLHYWGMRQNVPLFIKAKDIFDGFIYYAHRMLFTEEILFIIFSMPPGTGKSFILDSFSSWSYGKNNNMSILRISYSDSNVISSSNNVRNIMKTQAFAEVFPLFATVSENNMFYPEKEDMWKVSFADKVQYSFIASPRGGQITGKRAEVIIIDDITKGTEEANSLELKDKIYNWFNSDVMSRKHAGKDAKAIVAGTVWSDDDLLERLRLENDDMQETPFFGTEVSKDGSIVSVKIAAIDEETGKNNVEYAHSTKYLLRQKRTMSEYSWQALYQQTPIAQTGMLFPYPSLQKYSSLPEKGEKQGVYASLDPQRRGKNYLSMPITYKIDNKFYLVDCLFRKSQMKDLYELIVEKIIFHNINNLLIENNTDTSLKTLIEEKLHERGYFACKISEKYSTKNKELRILENEVAIKNYIVFPAEIPSEITEMGNALRQLNRYSTDKRNRYDDFPDSLALLMDAYCSGKQQFAKLKAHNNPFYVFK